MNYSRQRESILNILQRSLNHPTAYQVYELVKKVEPTISQSTVYRNLQLLVKNGKVRKLSCGESFEHYDIVRDVHSHAICTSCRSIFDVFINVEEIKNVVKNQVGFNCYDEVIVMGKCKNCSKED